MSRGRDDVAMEPLVAKLDQQGLPEMQDEDRAAEVSSTTATVAALLIIPRLLCFGIAYLIYRLADKPYYDAQIAFFTGLTGTRWGYLYISVLIFSMLTAWLNTVPMVNKARIFGSKSGHLRANMYIYKVLGDRVSQRFPAVILEDEGLVGEYNRANRSLHHFVEWSAAVALTIPFAGSVFPMPTFIEVVMFAVGRVWHQAAYSAAGHGAEKGGFILATLMSSLLEQQVFLVALKVFEVL